MSEPGQSGGVDNKFGGTLDAPIGDASGQRRNRVRVSAAGDWEKDNGGNRGPDSDPTAQFIRDRSRLQEVSIMQAYKTKRLGLMLSAILLMMACLVPVFAPEGRENVSYFVGLALFVFSAGSVGYTQILFKTKLKELKLESD